MASKINLNKKSQVTIFVILALIIVVIVILIFLLRSPPKTKVFDEDEPQAFIESCTNEYVEDAIFYISRHGGSIEPKGSITFKDIDRNYLCYNNNYFEPCINQHPLLIEEIETEITNYIYRHLEVCFEELKQNFEKRYEVSLSPDMQVKTTLQHKNILIEIGRELETTRGDEARKFEKFEIHFDHPMYDLAEISMEIVNQETQYCNFDVIGFMFLNPEYDVIKFITGDSNIIYQVTERSTDQKFTFATRGCVLPPNI